jgi:hypothetical protein
LGPPPPVQAVARDGRAMESVTRALGRRWASLRETVSHFMYGMTGYEFARHAVEMRHQMEAVFMVVTLGDLVGIPVLPPIYTLRLLPYVVPEIATWKRHLARRKEFWEKEEYDLHGI